MMKLALVGISLLALSSATAAQEVIPVKKQDSLQKFEYTKYVAAGRKTLLGFAYAINPDCTVIGPVDIKMSAQPEHGTVEIVEGKYYPNYAQDNPRSKCNAEKVGGLILYYKSNEGYTGVDQFEASSLLPTGALQEAHFNVNVR